MSAVLTIADTIAWEDYERGEKVSQIRHEFVNGQVFAMAGATDNHNRISGNIFSELRSALKGQLCEAFMADMKLKIALADDIRGYYPDVFVACEPNDGSNLHREKPKVIVEVTSGSTARTDRQEKRLAYLTLNSLEEYVIVEQAKMKATIYRRSSGWKALETEGPDAVLEFLSLGVTLTFAEVYERVDWERNDEPPLEY